MELLISLVVLAVISVIVALRGSQFQKSAWMFICIGIFFGAFFFGVPMGRYMVLGDGRPAHCDYETPPDRRPGELAGEYIVLEEGHIIHCIRE